MWKLIFLQCWRSCAFTSLLIAITQRRERYFLLHRYFNFLLCWQIAFLLLSFVCLVVLFVLFLLGELQFYFVHFMAELYFSGYWYVQEIKVIAYQYGLRIIFLPWESCNRMLQVNPDVSKYVVVWVRESKTYCGSWKSFLCSVSCRNCVMPVDGGDSWIVFNLFWFSFFAEILEILPVIFTMLRKIILSLSLDERCYSCVNLNTQINTSYNISRLAVTFLP